MRKIFVIVGILQPIILFGWGKDGHQIVAMIAKSQLESKAKDKVEHYLFGMSFEDAATWMDDIKKERAFDYMKPWHYVNIDEGAEYVQKDTVSDINSSLKINLDILKNYKNNKDADVSQALRILFHLCGDMAQPLHVGYGGDKGGNGIKLDYKGKPSNLHKVWDSEIINSENIDYTKCNILLQSFTQKQISDYKKFSIDSWMNDSRKLLPQVYRFHNGKIDEKYIEKNSKLIESQLVIGGIRLAELLNQLFKD